MRYSIIMLSVLLALGCGSKTPREGDADVITRVGVIAAREDASMNDVEKDTGSRTRTSVHASVSSGGGVAIGLGFFLSPLMSSGSSPDPVRYEVNFIDGGQMTIYHDSRDFEVDDCVKIIVHPNEKKYPPTMKRNKGGCQAAIDIGPANSGID